MKKVTVYGFEWEHNLDEFDSYTSHGEPLWECLKWAKEELERFPDELTFELEDNDNEDLCGRITEHLNARWNICTDYMIDDTETEEDDE